MGMKASRSSWLGRMTKMASFQTKAPLDPINETKIAPNMKNIALGRTPTFFQECMVS